MAPFSPTELVFAGFRFARQRPTAILIWSAYYLVVLTVAALAFQDLTGDKPQQFMLLAQNANPDSKALLALMQDILPAVGFVALLMIVLGAVMRTAVIRSLTASSPPSWGGLRLGGDELRVLGAYVALTLMLFLCWMTATLIAGLISQGGQLATLVLVMAGLAGVWLLWVRLSLAPMIAFEEHRISLRRSFAMTKGSFWRLVAAYGLLVAIAALVLILINALFAALIAAVALGTGGGMADVGRVLSQKFEGVNPLLIGLTVLSNLIVVWWTVICLTAGLGIAVRAYRALLPGSPKG